MYFCKLNFVTQLVKFNFASKNCVSDSSEVKTVSLTYYNIQFLFNKIFHEYYKDSSSFHLTLTRDRYHRLSSDFTSTE